MPTFVIINRPPADYRPSAEAAQMWTRWFAEIGDNLVDRGNPVFTRDTVGAAGEGSILGGYTLVTADNLAEAVRLAENCPAVQQGGGAEVGELTMLNAGREPA